MRQVSTQACVADDLGHPQNPGRHAISTQSGALSRAPLTLKDRPQPRPENISNCRWVRTCAGHRAVRHPTLEQSGYFRKLGEERQLPQRRCAPVLVPANLEPTARCIHPQFRPLLGLLRACAPDSQHQPFLLKFRPPSGDSAHSNGNTASPQLAPSSGTPNEENRINGNPRWYRDANGNYFWSGGVSGPLAEPYRRHRSRR